jgi:ribosomal-protein-alanine N-acetyltransferase
MARSRALDAHAAETGERVWIRRPLPSDRDRFLALVRESRRLHRPWVTPPGTPEAFDAYLRRGRRADREQFVVSRRDDGDLAGVINVQEIVRGCFQSAFLGYYAFAPHAGTGLMAEGLQLVLRHAFGRLGLHRLEANVQPANFRSVRLVQRAGFRCEGFAPRYLKVGGRWRDHEHWVLLAEEWRGRRARRNPDAPGRSAGAAC